MSANDPKRTWEAEFALKGLLRAEADVGLKTF